MKYNNGNTFTFGPWSAIDFGSSLTMLGSMTDQKLYDYMYAAYMSAQELKNQEEGGIKFFLKGDNEVAGGIVLIVVVPTGDDKEAFCKIQLSDHPQVEDAVLVPSEELLKPYRGELYQFLTTFFIRLKGDYAGAIAALSPVAGVHRFQFHSAVKDSPTIHVVTRKT